ncbi:hypothetical protein ACYATP_02580 [Lactobacillaceae bacterium Melli_B4]
MDFTNAYKNIRSILNHKNQYWLYQYQYNHADIETYLCNDSENNMTIYLIIRFNHSESLKSISIIQKDDDSYYFNAMWPSQSFNKVFSIIINKNGKKTNEFFGDWISRLEKFSQNDLKIENERDTTNYIKHVARTNYDDYVNRCKKQNIDNRVYPNSIKHRARKHDGSLNNISDNQKEKIIYNFGYQAFKILQKSTFTLTFTSNPLKQKNINLLDLDQE